jgi:DNA-binding MarR family transcriptional regulator
MITNEKSTTNKLGITSYQAMLSVTQSQQSLENMLPICLGHYGLNMMQWLVIGALLEGPQKPITLAKNIGVTPPYVTLVLHQINELGYITKAIIEDDRRSKIVCISPKGIKLAKHVETKLMSCIVREMGDIPANDFTTFLEVTDFIASNVRHR